MKYVSTLFVIALLQLCRAEISNSLPKWYEANLINESSYQPKPITEIFTTPETLSSRPIVVANPPTTTETERQLSTISSTTSSQASVEESSTTEETTRRVLPIDRNTSILPRPQDEREQRVVYQPQPRPIQVISTQSLPDRPMSQVQSFPQFQASPQQQQSTGQPNYFLIYQQAPLSIQQYPESASQFRPSTIPESTQRSTREPITASTIRESSAPSITTQSTTTTSATTERPQSNVISGIQMSSSTMRPVNRGEQMFVTSSPILFGGPWPNPSTLLGPAYYNPSIFSSPTAAPSVTSTGNPTATTASVITTTNAISAGQSTQRVNKTPALTIRVTAPRGSITNIKINPSSTTRRPSSRRPQSRKGHNYSVCVNSCKGKKEPICGAPLNMVPINPDKLKGFPSICHLACHNSFRKNQPFEKIMDGRCSKLRTRIRTVDKSKIRRDELNKSQYTVLSNNEETVVQIMPNERNA